MLVTRYKTWTFGTCRVQRRWCRRRREFWCCVLMNSWSDTRLLAGVAVAPACPSPHTPAITFVSDYHRGLLWQSQNCVCTICAEWVTLKSWATGIIQTCWTEKHVSQLSEAPIDTVGHTEQRTMSGKIMSDLKAQWGRNIRARVMISSVKRTRKAMLEEDRERSLIFAWEGRMNGCSEQFHSVWNGRSWSGWDTEWRQKRESECTGFILGLKIREKQENRVIV